MAGGFTGDPAQFAEANRKVDEVKLQMDQNLSRLGSEIEATQAGWQGPAAKVFQEVMEAFKEKSMKLNQALDDISQMLKSSGVQYDTQDQDVQQQISQLSATLEGL